MRFEIKTGGTFAILIGLGLLSGAVFLLGLVAGYEMGRQQENNRQFAAVYPMPSPPAAEPSPSTGLTSASQPAATQLPPPAAAITPAVALAAAATPAPAAVLPPPNPSPALV